MPQPLSRIKPDLRSRQGGPGIFLRRPVLGAYVTEVISLWSHAEANFGSILASCLHADSAVGLRMYLSISGSEARRAALYAAAEHSLSEGKLRLVRSGHESSQPREEMPQRLRPWVMDYLG